MNYQPRATASLLVDVPHVVDQCPNEKHAHAAWVLLTEHLAVDVRLADAMIHARPLIADYYLKRLFRDGQGHHHAQQFVGLVSVLDRVDTRFRDGRFEVGIRCAPTAREEAG